MGKLPKFEHTVGSHSDDRGGESDRRCDCQDSTDSKYSSELDKMLIEVRHGRMSNTKAKAIIESILRRVEVRTSIARLRSLPDVRLGGDSAQWFEDYLWAEIEKLEAELKELEKEQ